MAAKRAREVSSAAVDAVSFVAELGEGLPLFQPVLKTLTGIREKVKTVISNREDLAALRERCAYITGCVIVKFRKESSEFDVAPLEDCIRAAGALVEHCGRRGKLLRVVKASSDRGEIAALNARIRALESDMGLAGITVVGRKIDDLKTIMVSCLLDPIWLSTQLHLGGTLEYLSTGENRDCVPPPSSRMLVRLFVRNKIFLQE